MLSIINRIDDALSYNYGRTAMKTFFMLVDSIILTLIWLSFQVYRASKITWANTIADNEYKRPQDFIVLPEETTDTAPTVTAETIVLPLVYVFTASARINKNGSIHKTDLKRIRKLYNSLTAHRPLRYVIRRIQRTHYRFRRIQRTHYRVC